MYKSRVGLGVSLLSSSTLASRRLVYPALALNFLTGTLDPRITFSRGTTATFVGSNGLIQTAAINTPRFGYDPVTLQPKGLLVEEQRTNLFNYSAQFDNAYWAKTNGTITADALAAPDGTISADLLVENTANGTHDVRKTAITASASTAYTQSIFVKAAGRTKGQMQMFGNSGGSTVAFDLTAVTATATGAYGGWASASASITSFGNGWYRITNTATTNVGLTAVTNGFYLANASGSSTYTGDGTSGMYFWGAQLEAGSFATSYIPTVASTVTRSADVATMTGTNFSSWYNQSEGTFVANCDTTATSTVSVVMAGSDDNNRVQIGHTGSTDALFRIVNSGSAANPANITADKSGFTAALAYQQSNAGASVSGSAVSTSIPTAMVGHSALYIGANAAGGLFLNGRIRTIAYYNTRLSNSQLQRLTQ